MMQTVINGKAGLILKDKYCDIVQCLPKTALRKNLMQNVKTTIGKLIALSLV